MNAIDRFKSDRPLIELDIREPDETLLVAIREARSTRIAELDQALAATDERIAELQELEAA